MGNNIPFEVLWTGLSPRHPCHSRTKERLTTPGTFSATVCQTWQHALLSLAAKCRLPCLLVRPWIFTCGWLCLQDESSHGGLMHPLFLWQTCLGAAIQSCYASYKQADLGNLPKRLALCLVMLALLPATARPMRSLRVKAIARAAERAREQGGPHHVPCPVFFRACPASNLRPPHSPQGRDADAGQSDAAQEVQGSNHQMVCSPHNPASLDEMEPFTSPPSDKSGAADSGPGILIQLSPVSNRAPLQSRQGAEILAFPHQ